MEALFAIAMNPKESGTTRVAAIARILEREIGRPGAAATQPSEAKDASALSDDELLRIAARGRAGDDTAEEMPG